jgi:hypothetical protein
MEAICSSETSVDFQRTTRHYNPEASILHNLRCENLKSCTIFQTMQLQQNALFAIKMHFVLEETK